nr:MAG TPA: hypothetical protein [Caudoviricetes sp.]
MTYGSYKKIFEGPRHRGRQDRGDHHGPRRDRRRAEGRDRQGGAERERFCRRRSGARQAPKARGSAGKDQRRRGQGTGRVRRIQAAGRDRQGQRGQEGAH